MVRPVRNTSVKITMRIPSMMKTSAVIPTRLLTVPESARGTKTRTILMALMTTWKVMRQLRLTATKTDDINDDESDGAAGFIDDRDEVSVGEDEDDVNSKPDTPSVDEDYVEEEPEEQRETEQLPTLLKAVVPATALLPGSDDEEDKSESNSDSDQDESATEPAANTATATHAHCEKSHKTETAKTAPVTTEAEPAESAATDPVPMDAENVHAEKPTAEAATAEKAATKAPVTDPQPMDTDDAPGREASAIEGTGTQPSDIEDDKQESSVDQPDNDPSEEQPDKAADYQPAKDPEEQPAKDTEILAGGKKDTAKAKGQGKLHLPSNAVELPVIPSRRSARKHKPKDMDKM